MKIPLRKIFQTDVLSVEATVDLSELGKLNNDIREIGSVHVKCEAKKREDLIHCDLQITGIMILPCARTLVDVRYPFEINVLELFSTDPYSEGKEDTEVHRIEGDILDLEPYIKENVLLEIPLRVYAPEDEIEKNALSAGEGWSVVSEEEISDKIDPRMAKLQSLLNEKKNENQ